MPITLEEQADLDKLHAETAKLQEVFSQYVRHILEMGPEELKHSGHKTMPDVLVYAAKLHVKKCNDLVKAHLKKWPD